MEPLETKDKIEYLANKEGEESPLSQRRNRFLSDYKNSIFTAILMALIGLLGWFANINYQTIHNDIAELKTWKSTSEARLGSLKDQIQNLGNELTTLKNQSFYGKTVFYRDKDIVPADKGKKICALNLNYPWPSSRRVLRDCLGKTVRISIDGHYDNSQDFEVRGFFTSKSDQDSNIVEIPKDSLREKIFVFVNSKRFENFIAFIIFLNAIS